MGKDRILRRSYSYTSSSSSTSYYSRGSSKVIHTRVKAAKVVRPVVIKDRRKKHRVVKESTSTETEVVENRVKPPKRVKKVVHKVS